MFRLLTLRKMNDDNQFVITHQKVLRNIYGSKGKWMDGQVIETDTVLQVYIDEKYLVLLCFSMSLLGQVYQRTVIIRCVETFKYVNIVSIPTNCAIPIPISSHYSNGLFVTEFPDIKSKNFLWLKY